MKALKHSLDLPLTVAACAILVSCSYSERNRGGESQISIRDVPSAKLLYSDGLEEARLSLDDPLMIGIDISISPERSITSFDFVSLEDPRAVLIIFIRQNDGLEIHSERVEVPDASRLDDVIEQTEWRLDSTEVARSAFESGGSEYLERHPEVNQALLQLGTISGSARSRMGIEWEGIAWRVSFYQLPSPSLDYYFDPIDGTLIGTIRTPAE